MKKTLFILLFSIMLLLFVTACTSNDSSLSEGSMSCTLTVECKTVLENKAMLSEDKADIIPKDGIFAHEIKIGFDEGDTAFDVLQKFTRSEKLHLDFDDSVYGAYIKGIGNLYLGDCGEMSAWFFKVNGKSINESCSQYTLKDGDKIEFLYSCDFGADVGIEMY